MEKGKRESQEVRYIHQNPFGFTRKILGQKRSGQLACMQEELDKYLSSTYRDSAREQDLGPCSALITPPELTSVFNIKEPTLKEVEEVVKAARTSSAPGPSGVPYVVYKRCPKLLQRLWRILKVIWRNGKVAQQWRYAEGVWIPKEKNSSTIEQFLLRNEYIDTSVQKGGVPRVLGCIEHTGVVIQPPSLGGRPDSISHREACQEPGQDV